MLDPQPGLEIDHVDGYPVIPRKETIEYVRDHDAQFQPALAMLDRMYNDLDVVVAPNTRERSDEDFEERRDDLLDRMS